MFHTTHALPHSRKEELQRPLEIVFIMFSTFSPSIFKRKPVSFPKTTICELKRGRNLTLIILKEFVIKCRPVFRFEIPMETLKSRKADLLRLLWLKYQVYCFTTGLPPASWLNRNTYPKGKFLDPRSREHHLLL